MRSVHILKTVLGLSLLITALAVVSDSAPQRDAMAQLPLARLMPKGALLYAQSRDLAGQFRLWRTSAAHDRYFASKSYQAFEQSRLFLKLQSRVREVEAALGVEFSEDTIGALAGGASAVGIYDLDRLEMVVVSEMARAKALGSVLFANAKNFDERTAAGGAVYYARAFMADGGRLQQSVAFAFADGKLLLSSSEGLLQRTLENVRNPQGNDRLSDEVGATVAKAAGFTAHDITLWLNQAKLNANPYFSGYWIHRNAAELNALQTGLIDLEITPARLNERRWFVFAEPPAGGARVPSSTAANRTGLWLARTAAGVKGEQLARLLRYAPPGAQFVEARAVQPNDSRLIASVAAALFGQLPEGRPETRSAFEGGGSSGGSGSESERPGRYRHLDARFDRDIDDEAAVKLTAAGGERAAADKRFTDALAPVLAAAKPLAYVVVETPQLDANQLFVRFNRAVVIEFENVTALGLPRFENAVADEMQARFVVGSTGQRLSWQVEGNVHGLRQALLEQGGAYAVGGKSLVLASNKEYCAAVAAQGAAATGYAAALPEGLVRYAVVRPRLGRPVFAKLTKVLDAEPVPSSGSDQTEGDGDEGGPVAFFSQNLTSLLGVIDGVGEATFESAVVGDLLLEVVVYRLG